MAKDIEPKLQFIKDYLKVEKSEIFVIPEYQRGYSWSIPQCDKLWQDIELFIDLGETDDPYFFGTIIVDCSKDKKFSLIDGQQRTITFLLLLKSLLIRLMEVLDKFADDRDSEGLKEGLKENRNNIIRILYKVEPEDRVALIENWYNTPKNAILQNHSINEKHKDEVQKILIAKKFEDAEKETYKIPYKKKDNKYTNHFRNFQYFYNKLLKSSESQLNNFAKIFLGKCQVIAIHSWQIEQAITMFNSLNSTGMPLSDADIISAQLYSNSGDDKDNFNTQWEEINKLAEELNNLKIVNIDSILQQFMYINRAINKEYMSGETGKSVDVRSPSLRRYYTEIKSDLLKNPLDLCKKFNKIIQIWNTIREYPIIKLLLKFNENVMIYLSGYLYRFDIQDITQESILEVSECLLKLFTILELVDSGYSSKNFKIFLLAENTKLVDNNIALDTIKNDFKNHITRSWKKENIKELINEYDKNILVYLNEYLYAKSKGQVSKFDFSGSVNIEHIMPASGRDIDTIRQDAGLQNKDEFNSIANKLGNKILLEEKINKSLANEWFRTKKLKSVNGKYGYKDSKYAIAVALTNYPKDTWKKDDIEKATSKVSDRIVEFIFD